MPTYKTDRKTSARMRKVSTSDTGPERVVRKALSQLGLKMPRISKAILPGRPDFVVRPKNKAIFVHGCFWHRHRKCSRSSMPLRNAKLWKAKFDNTVRRDRASIKALKELGWDVLVVWECEVLKASDLDHKLQEFLGTN